MAKLLKRVWWFQIAVSLEWKIFLGFREKSVIGMGVIIIIAGIAWDLVLSFRKNFMETCIQELVEALEESKTRECRMLKKDFNSRILSVLTWMKLNNRVTLQITSKIHSKNHLKNTNCWVLNSNDSTDNQKTVQRQQKTQKICFKLNDTNKFIFYYFELLYTFLYFISCHC